MALANDLIYANFTSRQADFLGDTQADNITAVGTLQSDGYSITASINNFTVVTGAAYAAVLPIIIGCKYSEILVRNSDAVDDMTVYPGVGDSINALAVNTGITVGFGSAKIFKKVNTTKWIST